MQKARSRAQAIEMFNYHTSTLYTLVFQAVCIAQILPPSTQPERCLLVSARSIPGIYSGYRASSISALISAIEGSLTRIVSSSENSLLIAATIDRVVDRAIETAARPYYERMWVSEDYRSKHFLFGQDERVFAFETYRHWLQKSFFRNTGEYDGVTWLNRHMFAHGSDSTALRARLDPDANWRGGACVKARGTFSASRS
jgi:hypothetical protein